MPPGRASYPHAPDHASSSYRNDSFSHIETLPHSPDTILKSLPALSSAARACHVFWQAFCTSISRANGCAWQRRSDRGGSLCMKSVRFFWRYVTYRKDLLMALLGCALVTAAAELTIPWLLRQAIDTALGEMSG